MNKPVIREIVHKGKPFTVKTSDGEKHAVPHSDFIAIGSDNDETIVIYKEAGGLEIIDIFNITSLDLQQKTA